VPHATDETVNTLADFFERSFGRGEDDSVYWAEMKRDFTAFE
jgi:hypothetical protein